MTKESINRGKQFQIARNYRGYRLYKLCQEVEGLSQIKLRRYEIGFNELSDNIISKAMEILDFPLSFLDRDHRSFDVEFLS